MEIREDHHEDDPTTALYQAAVAGSVPSFKNLIQKDPLILNKVSLTHFSDTPLHTSALLGHLEFTKALLNHNSRLARVRESLRRPPLLLASAEGHKETVQALLKAYPDACLFRDQDGRIPLHYAAMRGHTEVLAELMHAKPESVPLRVLDRGDTAFHLCVIYNQLECLKLLVEEVGENRDFLNARAGSNGGMTILELAVMLRQVQAALVSNATLSILLTSESNSGIEREMEIRGDHYEDDPTTALYQAAVAGSVSSFKNLIQKDPLILNKVSLTHFSDTPLHTSALLGHLEFTKALLNHNSRLAQMRDSLRRPPLLLASAEGHKETVQALLKAYPDACLFRDQNGRTPLHYAAMRGHAEVLADLLRAKPESVSLRVIDRSGDTVFHLCVNYNQLECLKLLVEEVRENGDFLNARAGCDGGMTILELAVMLRQIQTIRYLLSLPVVRAEATTVGNEKVMQMLENSPRDFTSLEIQQVLMQADIMRDQRTENKQQPPLPNNKTKKQGKKGKKSETIVKDHNGRNWVEEKRGMLMVVGTMISTMTFQAAINPPGGFWQDFNTNSTFQGISYCNATNPCLAGTAVSSYIHPEFFNLFQVFNTACFLFSLSITLLLISGFPLRKRLLVWLLVVVMCLTLTFLTLTFYYGVQLVLPNRVSTTTSVYINETLTLFWLPLLALVVLYHTARFLIWLVKKLVRIVYPKLKRSTNSKSISPQHAVHSQEVGSCV